jgi:hypothetical protein
MFANFSINIVMSIKTTVDLVRSLLDEARRNKHFDSKYQDLAYQIGYLIGLIAWLADRDSLVKHEIQGRLNQLTKNSKK